MDAEICLCHTQHVRVDQGVHLAVQFDPKHQAYVQYSFAHHAVGRMGSADA